MRAQAGDRVVDIVDGEHDAMQTERVGRRVLRLRGGRGRRVVLGQLQLAVAVGDPHHRDLASKAVESDRAIGPTAFDRLPTLLLHTELGEERDCSIEIVENNTNIVHPLDRYILEYTSSDILEDESAKWTLTFCQPVESEYIVP